MQAARLGARAPTELRRTLAQHQKGLFLTIAWPSLHINQISELQNSSRTLLDPSISKVDEAASCMTNDAVLLFYDRALSRCTASIYITGSSVDRNSISITITSEGQV